MGCREVSHRRLNNHLGTVLAHLANRGPEQQTAVRGGVQARHHILIETICRQVAIRCRQRRLAIGSSARPETPLAPALLNETSIGMRMNIPKTPRSIVREILTRIGNHDRRTDALTEQRIGQGQAGQTRTKNQVRHMRTSGRHETSIMTELALKEP